MRFTKVLTVLRLQFLLELHERFICSHLLLVAHLNVHLVLRLVLDSDNINSVRGICMLDHILHKIDDDSLCPLQICFDIEPVVVFIELIASHILSPVSVCVDE